MHTCKHMHARTEACRRGSAGRGRRVTPSLNCTLRLHPTPELNPKPTGRVQARVGGARQARDALTKLHPTPELNPQPIGRVQARVGGARQALRLALLVEDGVWPEYTLYEAGTWMAHRKELGRRTHAPVRGRGVARCISIYTDIYRYIYIYIYIYR